MSNLSFLVWLCPCVKRARLAAKPPPIAGQITRYPKPEPEKPEPEPKKPEPEKPEHYFG